MTECTKIMEVMYSSAVKMGGIHRNSLAEFSLDSPPEQPSEEKQETLSREHFCGRTEHALGASVPGWQCHISHLLHFYLGSSEENPLVKHHAAYKYPVGGTPSFCYHDMALLLSK